MREKQEVLYAAVTEDYGSVTEVNFASQGIIFTAD
jgi:hypothetical protein